jgi:hypothetical protein
MGSYLIFYYLDQLTDGARILLEDEAVQPTGTA